MTKKNKLTTKQKSFGDEYIKNGDNGAQAMLDSDFVIKNNDPVTAATMATEYLRKPHVQEYIASQRKRLQKVTNINQKRVLDEESCISFLDPGLLFELKSGSLVPPYELPENVRRAISAIEIIEKESETVYKYKFWDKGRSLERVSKFLGLYEKDNKQKETAVIAKIAITDMTEEQAAQYYQELLKGQ
jgi:hypothetical protein